MYGDMFAKAITSAILISIAIAAPAGWVLIEGCIWLYHHVSVVIQ